MKMVYIAHPFLGKPENVEVVVHCGECKNCPPKGYCAVKEIADFDDNGYCSYGERRESEEGK